MPQWVRNSALLFVLFPVSGAVSQAQSVLIPGVPYVSWRDAAKVTTEQARRDVNPSITASRAMVRAYWTVAQDGSAPGSVLLACCQGGGEFRQDSAGSFEDLKPLLASFKPIALDLALTTDGHPLTKVFVFGRSVGMAPQVKWPEGTSSLMLGTVMPLWAVDSYRTALQGFSPVMEGLVVAERVLIGYDEARGVVIVHDPSFGPAVEMAMGDFERMWAAANRRYETLEPPDAENVVVRRAGAAPYRNRTTEERAAQLWVQGTVRASLAMAPEAERDLRAALALPGLGTGYEHLVQLDLGAVLMQQQRYADAITALQRSVALVPENPRGWELLAEAATAAGQGDLAKDAAKREKKARQVRDPAALSRRLDEAIPADLWLAYFAEVRGWGVTPKSGR